MSLNNIKPTTTTVTEIACYTLSHDQACSALEIPLSSKIFIIVPISGERLNLSSDIDLKIQTEEIKDPPF